MWITFVDGRKDFVWWLKFHWTYTLGKFRELELELARF